MTLRNNKPETWARGRRNAPTSALLLFLQTCPMSLLAVAVEAVVEAVASSFAVKAVVVAVEDKDRAVEDKDMAVCEARASTSFSNDNDLAASRTGSIATPTTSVVDVDDYFAADPACDLSDAVDSAVDSQTAVDTWRRRLSCVSVEEKLQRRWSSSERASTMQPGVVTGEDVDDERSGESAVSSSRLMRLFRGESAEEKPTAMATTTTTTSRQPLTPAASPTLMTEEYVERSPPRSHLPEHLIAPAPMMLQRAPVRQRCMSLPSSLRPLVAVSLSEAGSSTSTTTFNALPVLSSTTTLHSTASLTLSSKVQAPALPQAILRDDGWSACESKLRQRSSSTASHHYATARYASRHQQPTPPPSYGTVPMHSSPLRRSSVSLEAGEGSVSDADHASTIAPSVVRGASASSSSPRHRHYNDHFPAVGGLVSASAAMATVSSSMATTKTKTASPGATTTKAITMAQRLGSAGRMTRRSSLSESAMAT